MADQESTKKGALELPQINIEELNLNVKKPRCHSDTSIFNVVSSFRHSGLFPPTADLDTDNTHLAVKSKKERSKTRTSYGSTEKALDFIAKLKDDFSAKLLPGSPKPNHKTKESKETVSCH